MTFQTFSNRLSWLIKAVWWLHEYDDFTGSGDTGIWMLRSRAFVLVNLPTLYVTWLYCWYSRLVTAGLILFYYSFLSSEKPFWFSVLSLWRPAWQGMQFALNLLHTILLKLVLTSVEYLYMDSSKCCKSWLPWFILIWFCWWEIWDWCSSWCVNSPEPFGNVFGDY